MELFLNCVFYCFTLVAVVWGMIQIFHTHIHDLAKAALLLLAGFLVFHLLPRSGFAHGPTLMIFGTIGIAVVAGYAIHHWHHWAARTTVVVLALGLILLKGYPYFASAGSMSSGSGIAPASSGSPATSAPAAAASTLPVRRSSRPASRTPSSEPDLCAPGELSYSQRKELGCP